MKLYSDKNHAPRGASRTGNNAWDGNRYGYPPSSPQRPKKGKKRGMSGGKIALLTIGILVAFLAVGLVGGAVAVNASDAIYPHVQVQGIEVGGMTVEDAAKALDAAGYNSYAGEAVTVNLPAGQTLSVTAQEAGVALDPTQAAQRAYVIGREGNLFANFFGYIRCALGSENTVADAEFQIDSNAVQQKVSEAVGRVYAALDNDSVTVSDDSVTVIKGAGSIQMDKAALYDMVETAFRDRNFAPQTYDPTDGQAQPLDVQSLYDMVYKDPVDAVYDPDTGAATQSEEGRGLDMDQAQQLWDGAKTGDAVVIPLTVTEPEITTDYLNSVLFRDVLGQTTTSLSGSSAARINNIALAASIINGKVLNPGDSFSFNGVVGQRTEAKGFKAAGAYNNGEVVSEVGGGICQVSSTLYNAVLYANLKIVERTCHYFSIAYLPLGLDATVSWPGPDFKFQNSRDYPVRIEAFVKDNKLTVSVYGTDVDGSYVKLEHSSSNQGNGVVGAVSYRVVYDKNGNPISRTLEARSTYYPHTQDQPSAEPSPSPNPSPSPDQPTTNPSPEPTPTPTPPSDTPQPTPPPDNTPAPPPDDGEG